MHPLRTLLKLILLLSTASPLTLFAFSRGNEGRMWNRGSGEPQPWAAGRARSPVSLSLPGGVGTAYLPLAGTGVSRALSSLSPSNSLRKLQPGLEMSTLFVKKIDGKRRYSASYFCPVFPNHCEFFLFENLNTVFPYFKTWFPKWKIHWFSLEWSLQRPVQV